MAGMVTLLTPALMTLHSSHSTNYTARPATISNSTESPVLQLLITQWDEEKRPCVCLCAVLSVSEFITNIEHLLERSAALFPPRHPNVKSLFIVLVEESSFHIAYQQHQLIVLLSRF